MAYLTQAPQDTVVQFLIEHRWIILAEAELEPGPLLMMDALAPSGLTMRFSFRDGFLVKYERRDDFRVIITDLPCSIEITGP